MKDFVEIEQLLLEDINKFLTKCKMTRSAFGVLACNDPKVVMRIEEGRELRSGTINAIRKYIAENTPLKEGGEVKEGEVYDCS